MHTKTVINTSAATVTIIANTTLLALLPLLLRHYYYDTRIIKAKHLKVKLSENIEGELNKNT